MTANDIRKVATQVRQWADGMARIHRFPGNLDTFCAIGARQLFIALQDAGFKDVQIAVHDVSGDGEAHCFVHCGPYLVDVTASQFGKPDVVVRQIESATDWFWEESHRFSSVETFEQYLKDANWPEDQTTLPEAK